MPHVRKRLCLEVAEELQRKASKAQADYERNKRELKELTERQGKLKQKFREAQRLADEFRKQALKETKGGE